MIKSEIDKAKDKNALEKLKAGYFYHNLLIL